MIKMTTLNILKILTEILKEYMHTSTFGLPPFCVTTFGRLTIFDTSEHPKASLIDLVKRRRKTNLRIFERGGVTKPITDYERDCEREDHSLFLTHQSVPRRLENEVGTPEFDWHSSILKLAIFDTSERPKTSLFDPLKGSKKQIGESLKGKGGGGITKPINRLQKRLRKTTHYF